MLRDSLLTMHIFGVIVWLGCGLYEFFLAHEIKKARGTSFEIPLIQLYGKYAPVVAVATLIVAIIGVLMSVLLGWGFFQQLWLGLKQGIMALIILDMLLMTPTFIRGSKEIADLSNNTGPELERYRVTFAKIERHVILMRAGAVVAVILAVWRPLWTH